MRCRGSATVCGGLCRRWESCWGPCGGPAPSPAPSSSPQRPCSWPPLVSSCSWPGKLTGLIIDVFLLCDIGTLEQWGHFRFFISSPWWSFLSFFRVFIMFHKLVFDKLNIIPIFLPFFEPLFTYRKFVTTKAFFKHFLSFYFVIFNKILVAKKEHKNLTVEHFS